MFTYAKYTIPCILLIVACYSCHSKDDQRDKLKSGVKNQLRQLDGTFAMAFINLADTTDSIFINPDEMFHAASTMKTPVMIEVFKQAAAGTFSLDDSIEVKNEFKSIVDSSTYKMSVGEDSNEKMYQYIGQKRPVIDLVYDMITTSSNLATNILVGKVGAKNITQTMRSFGCDSIQVLRGVEDLKAYHQGLNNETNARDLMTIFKKLGTGQAVSAEASDRMIHILKQQEFNEMIPAELSDSVAVAHKTGWITGVHHDSGLVILPDGRKYVLILLSKDAPNRERIIHTFADISKAVYDYVTTD